MYLAENVPVAICTPRTLTVRAKPVRATIAPTMVASTVTAVEAEYSQYEGGSKARSSRRPASPRTAPRIPPSERQRPEAPLQVLPQTEPRRSRSSSSQHYEVSNKGVGSPFVPSG